MNHTPSLPPSTTPATVRLAASGLEDVVAATTRLSDVDGAAGRLTLAGVPVEDLAGHATFEDVVHLLWTDRLPDATGRARIRDGLGRGREEAWARLGSLGDALALPDGMDALRAATGHLEPRASESALDECLRITGAVAVFAAAWARAPEAVRPDPRRSHAEDLLAMLRGAPPREHEVVALDTYLATVVDHGMNASTFAARVVASTASDTVSSVVAALGALKGRLHGGAPGPVLDMLDAIGTAADAAPWLDAALARGERIMGMGHRVYRVRDPRAFVLERALGRLEAGGPAERGAGGERLPLARAVEAEATALLARRHPERALAANVEFYTAVLLEALGVPRALFTPLFACSRVVGWCAHAEEQRRVGRLVRPASRYARGPAGALPDPT